jgi:hypothetical protein
MLLFLSEKDSILLTDAAEETIKLSEISITLN